MRTVQTGYTDQMERALRRRNRGNHGSRDISGAPPLAIAVQRVAGIGGCHHFHWRCRGCGGIVSVQKNNHNILHTNMNCKILQDSKKSAYNIIVLQNTTKCKKKENAPRKNEQKTA